METLQLNLIDNGSIKDAAGNPLQPGGTIELQSPQTISVGSNPYAVMFGDVNGDGRPDIIVPGFGSNTIGVLLGHGNGTFQAYTYPDHAGLDNSIDARSRIDIDH